MFNSTNHQIDLYPKHDVHLWANAIYHQKGKNTFQRHTKKNAFRVHFTPDISHLELFRMKWRVRVGFCLSQSITFFFPFNYKPIDTVVRHCNTNVSLYRSNLSIMLSFSVVLINFFFSSTPTTRSKKKTAKKNEEDSSS